MAIQLGQADLNGIGTVTSTGRVAYVGAADLVGEGILIGDTRTIVGIATIIAVGNKFVGTTVPTFLDGTGSIEGAPVVDYEAASSLQGRAWVSAVATVEDSGVIPFMRTRHKAYQVNPEDATIGQVLTADGLGDADWEDSAGDISGSGTDKYVAFFDGTKSIAGSANLQWDGKMLWFDRVADYPWGSGYPPDIGIQSQRPAIGICQDRGASQLTVVLYMEESDETIKLAWTPFRGVGYGGDETDWGYDGKVDVISIEPGIGWIGIGKGQIGSSFRLQIFDDNSKVKLNEVGQSHLVLSGDTTHTLALCLRVDTTNEIGQIQAYSGYDTVTELVLQPIGGNVGIGATPTANMAGLSIEAGLLTLKERTTPTADADYGKLYTKSDNVLYFQDGAGVEQNILTDIDGGDRDYTDENYVADDQTFTASIDAIDQQLVESWQAAGETWGYSVADDPTFTFLASGDLTSKYSAGMKIKLTQTTVKYFIITKVVYSSPFTYVTMYGGTDYDLTSATITLPYYSSQKAPYGFPLDPAKWTIKSTKTSPGTQSSPTADTWYNIGSFSISVPIGAWSLDYQLIARSIKSAATVVAVYTTLSKVNNAADDDEMTCMDHLKVITSTSWLTSYQMCSRSKFVTRTIKTTYYLLNKTNETGMAEIGYRGGTVGDSVIRAVCAYL